MAHIGALLLLVLTIFQLHVIATEESPPPALPPRGKSTMTPTLTIILVCLISTFFLTCFFSIYVHRCVHRQMIQGLLPGPTFRQGQTGWLWREEARTRGVDPRVVAAFPTFIYSEIKELKISECALECAICLNEFEDSETLQLLPKCWHVFHPDCIQLWLSSHVTCPVCRADLLNPVDRHVPILEPDVQVFVDDQSPDEITAVISPAKSTPLRSSTPRKELKFWATFRKSLSTGHSLVLPGENCERFTLRLPEDVQSKVVSSGLERARSCHVAFPRARSRKKGFRSTSTGGNYNNKWFFTATPPFFSRAGPSRTHDGEGSAENTPPPVGSLKSVASPFNRLFGRLNTPNDDVDVEDRSTDVLILLDMKV